MSTPTPPQYTMGSIKQDPATLAVAVRTNTPVQGGDVTTEWGVATVHRGGYRTSYDTVQGWPDIYFGGTPIAAVAANFSGSGGLTATTTGSSPVAARQANFSGSGTLTATAT